MTLRKGQALVAVGLGLAALLGVVGVLAVAGAGVSAGTAAVVGGGQAADDPLRGRALAAPEAQVYHVDADAPGTSTGSGLSWTDAFTEVQAALSVAQAGDMVWVAEGVYTPDYDPDLETHTGWVTATFALTDGVALYGGFDPDSGADTLEEQDPAAYVTALSGDLAGDDETDAHGVVTTTENIRGANAWTVVTASGVGDTAVLDGFTVTAGNANGVGCTPEEPCQSGGGMYSYESSPALADVTFSGNSAGRGGGMRNTYYSSPTLVNVTFSGNQATNYGGGMYNNNYSSPTLTDVTFSGNSAGELGGGVFSSYSELNLMNSTLRGNYAHNGGGINNNLGGVTHITNSLIISNSSHLGGGIVNLNHMTVVNSTISGNSAVEAAGGIYGSSGTLVNCILWGNSADAYDQILGAPAVSYSDIQGGWTGEGNINEDPLFVDADGGDLRLRPGSPAIDAGDNDAVPEWVTTDLAGEPRFADIPYLLDTGSGTPPIVDMGAYEMPPQPIYVDRDAAGANSGTSWADAFTELQSALAVTRTQPGAAFDVWVAEGAYTPDYNPELEAHTGWVTATFALTDGVALYGGFDPGVGVETMEERDPAAYVTVLSGDLDGDDTADAHGVVTTTENITGTNAWTVVTASGVTETAVLDGFTITAGNSDGVFGVDCEPEGPCRGGGGMHNYQSSPTLVEVTFSGNRGGRWGGGMRNYHGSCPTLTGVTFSGNSAGWLGGGMENYLDSSPTLVNVTFSGNSAEYGGGMTNYFNSSPTLVNVTFSGNSAQFDGGGMYNLHSSPTLVNVIFSGNSGVDLGGGMASVASSSPTLVNVIFSGNSAVLGGGGMYNHDSSPTLANGILWGNMDSGSDEEEAQIYNQSSVVTVTYSLVAGGVYTGTGNISADPQFVGVPDPGGDGTWGTPDDNYGDLRPRPGSPAIDAGDNAAVPEWVTTDLAGEPRFADVPSVPDTGSGAPPIVDLGAYEVPALGVLYVDADAEPGGSGDSWAEAFTEVQRALSVAQAGHEVWVAEGVYTPDYDPDQGIYTRWVTATFPLTDGVALYGGFDPGSGASAWDQRDPAAYVTALSGDLDGNDTADPNGVVTTTENITGTNAWTVVTASGVDGTAVLGGFTVTAGHANGTDADCSQGEPCQSGGGIYNYESSPTLGDLVFSGNSAPSRYGGGMYNWYSSPTLVGVTFSGNSAPSLYGGGMLNYASSPTLLDVTFSRNSAASGGGMLNMFRSSPTLVNVTFSGNQADYYGGGMRNEFQNSPKLVDVIFSGNSADYGGGMANSGYSSPTLVGVTFSGNSASSHGGGMSNEYSSSSTLDNCVLWGNNAPYGDQIYIGSSTAAVSYSDIQGDLWPGAGNINADPLFLVDPDPGGDGTWGTPDDNYGDLRLRPGSPAIDAGDNAAVPEGVTTDLAGEPRFADIPYLLDTGSGTPPIVDMGAYEMPPQPIYVDREAAGANSGTSWADAFTELQSALAVTRTQPGGAVEVWVAEGAYAPDYDLDMVTHTGWVTATFALTDGVALYGGFDPGSEADEFGERDPAAYVTVLSGDLDGNDTADAYGVVATTENITGTNAWTVVTASGVTDTAVLDGFTVTAGHADGAGCAPEEPCRSGGGMYNSGGSPTLAGVTFSGNRAGDYGGGFYNSGGSPELAGAAFSGNSAIAGGGMVNFSGSPELVNVIFGGNSAEENGGGMANYWDGSPSLVNVIFGDNRASLWGGGMLNWGGSSPELVNATLSGNAADDGDGMFNYDSSPSLVNCILWGNGAGTAADQIFNDTSAPIINYSLVQGGCPQYASCDGNLVMGDPLFVDAAGGDLRLGPGSPAIDAGDNDAVPEWVTTDLAGRPRFINGRVDMGAYEGPVSVFLPLVLRAAP